MYKWIIMLAFAGFLFSTGMHAQTIRILPLGNSITDGDDATHPAEGDRIAYRFNLYSLLTASGYDFDFVGHRNGGYNIFSDTNHGGIPGTRDQYIARLLQDGYDERWSQQITPGSAPYLDVYPADIILLHIGTNDITHGEGTSPAAVAQILDEIKAFETRSGNNVIVFVARIINRKVYNETTTLFNNNVAAMVAARNDPDIIMVDMENGAGINYSTEMQSDGIHPLPAGYSKIANKWFQAIQSLNTAPYFTSSPLTSAKEDIRYTYQVTVDDENSNDNLTIIGGTIPGWCSFTDNGDRTGTLTGVPDGTDVGAHNVSLVVSDGKSFDTQEFSILVDNTNDPPRITGQKALATNEDTPITLQKSDFTTVDEDNDPEDIELTILSGDNYTWNGLTITPDKDFDGTLLVNIKPADLVSVGALYQAIITVNPVNDPPVILGQRSTLEVKQYVPLAINVSDLYYEDVDNNMADLDVIVQPHPDGIYTVDGNTLVTQVDTLGMIEVVVVLSDGEDESAAYTLDVKVKPLNSPPQFTTTPETTTNTGEVYYYLVNAQDPDGDELSYYTTNMPDWLDFNEYLNFLGGKPSADDLGIWWVGIEVSDGNYRVEQLYQLTVELDTTVGIGSNIEIKGYGGAEIIDYIFPVPADDFLKINTIVDGELELEVIGISGKSLKKVRMNADSSNPVTLNVSDLGTGSYFLKVTTGQTSEVRRFVIYR